MKKIILSFTILVAMITAFVFNAQAATIHGYMSFSGTVQSDNESLKLATTFTQFTDVVVSTQGGTFDYASIPGNESVALKPFTFVPDVNSALFDFWVITYDDVTYSYDLSTSTIQFAEENSILIKGTGIASITDFADTDSIWFFSATSAGQDRTTFTLSTLVSAPVPEPATMLLFGLGLLGFASVARKKS